MVDGENNGNGRNTDKTPAESPAAKRSTALDTRVTGEGYPDEQTGNGAVPTRLSRHPPDLTPLPVTPTAIDVAVRYGQFAAFLMQQWPVLYDVVARVDDRISALERRQRSHWLLPMLLGVFGMLAVAEGIFIAVRWH